MASDIQGSVQAMEAEAAKVLEEARSKASDILLKAREEARSMSFAELPLDDVKAECDRMVKDAEQKAATDIQQAEKQADDIRSSAGVKTDQYTKLMVSIVRGEKTA